MAEYFSIARADTVPHTHREIGMETLWTTEQTARVLGMKAHTLEKWRTTGAGPPFIYVGGAVRYRPSAVEAWLESQTRRSTSDAGEGEAA